jgi:hypothetical protein
MRNLTKHIYIYLFTARGPKGFYNFFLLILWYGTILNMALNVGEHLYGKKNRPTKMRQQEKKNKELKHTNCWRRGRRVSCSRPSYRL